MADNKCTAGENQATGNTTIYNIKIGIPSVILGSMVVYGAVKMLKVVGKVVKKIVL